LVARSDIDRDFFYGGEPDLPHAACRGVKYPAFVTIEERLNVIVGSYGKRHERVSAFHLLKDGSITIREFVLDAVGNARFCTPRNGHSQVALEIDQNFRHLSII
jgi:hypothetical protein